MTPFRDFEVMNFVVGIHKKYSETIIPRILKICVDHLNEPQEQLLQFFGVSFVAYVGKQISHSDIYRNNHSELPTSKKRNSLLVQFRILK